jgi:HPt (histidine-containing phosphotransfer) domain-containing protein
MVHTVTVQEISMAGDSPLEGIDYAAALAQYQMENIYHRILATYVRSAPGLLETLAAFSKDDLENYIITVHGLKGASYGIQANKIGDLAKELEFAGKDGKINFILANNQHLIDETNALIARLAAYLDSAA